LRVEALNTLTYWEEPSIFDRVTGRHRGQVTNDVEYARDALGPVAERLLQDNSTSVKIAAIEAAAELEYNQAVPPIYALLEEDASADVRIAALRALRDLEFDEIDEAIRIALTDSEARARMNALSMIPELDIDEEVKVALLVSAFMEGTVIEKQTILRTFESLDNEAAYQFLDEQFDRLENGDLAREVHLELIETAEQLNSDQLNNRLEQYHQSKQADDLVALYSESLYGGDAESGRQIFYQNAAAQCIRCHAVDDSGAEVGPDLTDVGNRLSRDLLLQSMVNPSARLTPGFGVVTVTLHDGETLSGALEEETDDRLIISTREEKIEIEKSDIETRTNSPSAMPAMGDVLSRSQLRDLVEFMKSLDGEPLSDN